MYPGEKYPSILEIRRSAIFEMELKKLTPSAKLGLKGVEMGDIVTIPSHNLFVFNNLDDSKITVLENDTDGEIIHVFEQHYLQDPYSETKLIRLFADVLCSVDSDGNLFTWHAYTGKLLGTWKAPECLPDTLVKLNDAELALGCDGTRIFILQHAKGHYIGKSRAISVEDIDRITGLDRCGNTVAAIGANGMVEVWNYKEGEKISTIQMPAGNNFVKICDTFIIYVSRNGGIINIYDNDGIYDLVGCLDLHPHMGEHVISPEECIINDVTIINSDLMMVVGSIGFGFFTLPLAQTVWAGDFWDYKYAHSATILPDGLIYVSVGYDNATLIFRPPGEIIDDLKQFADEKLKESSKVTSDSEHAKELKLSRKEIEHMLKYPKKENLVIELAVKNEEIGNMKTEPDTNSEPEEMQQIFGEIKKNKKAAADN